MNWMTDTQIDLDDLIHMTSLLLNVKDNIVDSEAKLIIDLMTAR